MHHQYDFTIRPPWAPMIFSTLALTLFLLLVIWFASGVGISGDFGIGSWKWRPSWSG